MKARPTVVHVIDGLERGGAESLLVALLPSLQPHLEVVLVTLTNRSDFPDHEICCDWRYCLNYQGKASLPQTLWKLSRIIRRHRPWLVRSQLYMSSLVARLVTPRRVPFLFSIHNTLSRDCYARNRFALPLEKWTYRPRHAVLAVSREALIDFDHWVGLKGSSYVHYNFVKDEFFSDRQPPVYSPGEALRVVAVGNLREQKNYASVLQAVQLCRGLSIELDVFGEGPLRSQLQSVIDLHGLPVRLRGAHPRIADVLPDYHAYLMGSLYEGFGIAVAEAMAARLPVLASDLPVLREVTRGQALYFDPQRPETLASIFTAVSQGQISLSLWGQGGAAIAHDIYRRGPYVQRLLQIYSAVAQGRRAEALVQAT